MPRDDHNGEIDTCYELGEACGRASQGVLHLWRDCAGRDPDRAAKYRRLWIALDAAEVELRQLARELY